MAGCQKGRFELPVSLEGPHPATPPAGRREMRAGKGATLGSDGRRGLRVCAQPLMLLSHVRGLRERNVVAPSLEGMCHVAYELRRVLEHDRTQREQLLESTRAAQSIHIQEVGVPAVVQQRSPRVRTGREPRLREQPPSPSYAVQPDDELVGGCCTQASVLLPRAMLEASTLLPLAAAPQVTPSAPYGTRECVRAKHSAAVALAREDEGLSRLRGRLVGG